MQDFQPQQTWIAGPPTLSDEPSMETPAPTPARTPTTPRAKRLMAAGLLALGMLAGGAAMVSAASPDPSASTAPAAGGTQPTGPGGAGMPANGVDCPNM